MNSFYSQQAGCTVRWHDLPGTGDPVVFIHGWAAPLPMNIPVSFLTRCLARVEQFSSICPAAATAISLSTTAIRLPTRHTLWRN